MSTPVDFVATLAGEGQRAYPPPPCGYLLRRRTENLRQVLPPHRLKDGTPQFISRRERGEFKKPPVGVAWGRRKRSQICSLGTSPRLSTSDLRWQTSGLGSSLGQSLSKTCPDQGCPIYSPQLMGRGLDPSLIDARMASRLFSARVARSENGTTNWKKVRVNVPAAAAAMVEKNTSLLAVMMYTLLRGRDKWSCYV